MNSYAFGGSTDRADVGAWEYGHRAGEQKDSAPRLETDCSNTDADSDSDSDTDSDSGDRLGDAGGGGVQEAAVVARTRVVGRMR
jgi:hypothetical protein